MDYTLRKIPFTEDALPDMQEFACGTDEWEIEVAEDLKNPTALATWVREGTAEACLYVTAQGDIAGFGALSERSWRYPHPKKSPRQPISVFPDVAVHVDFQRKPSVPGVKQYSDQILDHLRFVAKQHTERLPLLGLMVHPKNIRAIGWYEKAGFVRLDGDWIHPVTKVAYWRMLLDLMATEVVQTRSEQTKIPDQQASEQSNAGMSHTSEQAISAVRNVPLLPEQRAKKDEAKGQREEHKRKQGNR